MDGVGKRGMDGSMEVWKYGRVEVWKYGSMEVWKYGRVEVGKGLEEDSTIKDECGRIRVWYSALSLSIWLGGEMGNV